MMRQPQSGLAKERGTGISDTLACKQTPQQRKTPNHQRLYPCISILLLQALWELQLESLHILAEGIAAF